MSMNVSSSSGEDESMIDINMTPMIDVLLVLIIYLIINLPIATHAIKLDLPRPNPNAQQKDVEPVVIDLEIDFDGSYYWNGAEVADMPTLDSYFRQAAKEVPQPELHIKPNPRVRYDFVAKALSSAQRNQLLRMGFVGQEAYIE
jgi:biopolymer transport protein ExbD